MINDCTLCGFPCRSEVLRIRHEAACAGAGATWRCDGCGNSVSEDMIDTHRVTCLRPRIRAVPRVKTLLDVSEQAGMLDDHTVTF